MQTCRLGASDIQVSRIGLGTVKFGRNQGVHYPQSFELPSYLAMANLLALARECGINLIDTAPAYGESELRLGKLLQTRDQWVIATKVGETFARGKSYFDFSTQAIHQSVHRSLQRLRTDYLDILLIHSNGDDEAIIKSGVFDTLSRLKSAGKIRAFGMSTKTLAGGLLTVAQADVAMIAYHPSYTAEREVIDEAARLQKGILLKKVFASGHQPTQDAMQFALNPPGVSSVIVGTLNPEHLLKNVEWACRS